VEEVDKTPPIDAAEDAYLRRRATTTTEWRYKNYDIVVTGLFMDGFQDYDANGNPFRVGSSWTWDVRLGYTVHNELGPYLKGTSIAVGSINVFNRQPPVAIGGTSGSVGASNTNGYPGDLYTSQGREIYVSLDKKF
jgi:hypothetical protein